MSNLSIQPVLNSLRSAVQRNRFQQIFIWAVAIVLLIVGSVISPDYRTLGNAANIIRQLCTTGILGIGQAILMIGGGIDLSVGTVVKLTSLLAAGIVNGRNSMVLPAILVVLLVGLSVGAVNGLLVTRLKIPPFIATLATASILRGLSLTYTTTVIGRASPVIRYLFFGSILGIPVPGVILLICVILGVYLLRRTVLGRNIYAVGGNEQVANLAGIRVNRTRMITFILCGMLAALAGLISFARMGVGDPVVGEGLELDSITAVILGGVSLFGGQGNLIGAIGGVLALTVINNLLNLIHASMWYQTLIKGLIIVIAVAAYKQRKQ
jgi:ribose/xylose/arabinose/galactoside ABC-type transport system permease subunit